MRVWRTALAILLALAVAVTTAEAATRIGIVRPDSEKGLSDEELGSQLYAGNCATCHGIAGEGKPTAGPVRGAGDVNGQGPSLKDAGELAADFYLRLGMMPLGDARQQPWREKPQFNEREIRALVKYVGSLGNGPAIPTPHPEQGRVSTGLHLFTEHCAGCHQVVAEGGMVTGARVPQIKSDTAVQIAEAVRTGPYVMPKFSEQDLSEKDLNSIIAYIEASKTPHDRGGWGLDHIGPIPEGMVTWFIAAVALLGLCAVIGERMKS